MSKIGGDNYQNITFVMDENYFDRIRVNRCQCPYCNQIYFSKEYVDQVGWKVFQCLRDNYLRPSDLLRALCTFDLQTTLFIKNVLNERLNMLNSGLSITAEEIENNNDQEESDPEEEDTAPELTSHTKIPSYLDSTRQLQATLLVPR